MNACSCFLVGTGYFFFSEEMQNSAQLHGFELIFHYCIFRSYILLIWKLFDIWNLNLENAVQLNFQQVHVFTMTVLELKFRLPSKRVANTT